MRPWWLAHKRSPALILVVGVPYLGIAGLCALALAVRFRWRVLSLISVILVTTTLLTEVSWYYLGRPGDIGEHAEIRLLSSNLFKGRADPAAFVRLAANNADVITVAELTPEAVQRFAAAGINDVFPFSSLLPAPEAGGSGIWSRYPIIALSAPRHRGVRMPAVRLQVPGVRDEPVLASVHVMSPVAGNADTVGEWGIGMAAAKAQLDDFTASAGPGAVIVGGDYNSTPDMRQFRDLLTDDFRDAVDQTGSGFAPTFPSDQWFPPVITIDHVVIRRAVAASVRVVDVEGSDHRALLVKIKIPSESEG